MIQTIVSTSLLQLIVLDVVLHLCQFHISHVLTVNAHYCINDGDHSKQGEEEGHQVGKHFQLFVLPGLEGQHFLAAADVLLMH